MKTNAKVQNLKSKVQHALATGKSPEPAGRNACPTSPDGAADDRHRHHPYQRKELVGILEEYGVSVRGFDGLRSDSYEKQIAGRSLGDLETFYGLPLGAGRSYKELAPECPKWGKEAKPRIGRRYKVSRSGF